MKTAGTHLLSLLLPGYMKDVTYSKSYVTTSRLKVLTFTRVII